MSFEERFDLRLFKLIEEGASNNKIAQQLGLALGTVNAMLSKYRRMMYIGGTRKNRMITSPIISKAVENFDFDSDVNTKLTMNELIELARDKVDTSKNTDDICKVVEDAVAEKQDNSCDNTETEVTEHASTEKEGTETVNTETESRSVKNSEAIDTEKANTEETKHTCHCGGGCKCKHTDDSDTKYSDIFRYDDALKRVHDVLKLRRDNDSTEVKEAFRNLCLALIEDGLNV